MEKLNMKEKEKYKIIKKWNDNLISYRRAKKDRIFSPNYFPAQASKYFHQY